VAAWVDVYIEGAPKRSFAGAIEWPGWTRSGRTEADALDALARYRDRYAGILAAGHLRPPPPDPQLRVVERLAGGSGTEYGVASVAPSADDEPLEGADLDRQIRLLEAAWAAFDRAAAAAQGVELAKGPRGGGRDLQKIAAHVVEAEAAYITALGAPSPKLPSDLVAALQPVHEAAIEALRARNRGEYPDVGARGGRRWSARYFVRRTAWHALDHAWEIEDRSGQVEPAG
jgi:hypothetical protein